MPTFVLHLDVHFTNKCVCVFKHPYARTSSSIFIYIYSHFYLYGFFNYLVLATHNLYVPIVICLYVPVPSQFAWCIHTYALMFEGLNFIMNTYLFLLSIHARHVCSHLLNFCMHLPFQSVHFFNTVFIRAHSIYINTYSCHEPCGYIYTNTVLNKN